MSATPNQQLQKEQSFLYFRVSIGGVCALYLVVLIFGRMIFDGFGDGVVLNSISDYYYSPSMHNVFVGGLCVIAALLMCYRYEDKDTVASFLAGICAIGVAIFPKAPDKNSFECPPNVKCPNDLQMHIGSVHYIFSALFLIIIALIVLVLFTQSKSPPDPSIKRIINPDPGKKHIRNVYYYGIGWSMIGCVVLSGIFQNFILPRYSGLDLLIFVFELASLILFISAWIIKGQALLWDSTLGQSTLLGIFSYIRRAARTAITAFSQAITSRAADVFSFIRQHLP
jgi:hypothetical protein